MTPDRPDKWSRKVRDALAFDKEFVAIFGLPNGLMPTVTEPDPIAADEAEHGVCAMGELPELSPAQLAEGDITSERL